MPSPVTSASKSSPFRDFLNLLEARFIRSSPRHPGIAWETIRERLENHPDKIHTLQQMEQTGGEPDLTGFDLESDLFVFMDCSPESPAGRRSLCFDERALRERNDNPPNGSASGMAEAMGIELLTEDDYRHLQSLGAFDTKTSSWIRTPDAIRLRGGALFGDCRYGAVFIYHNGAGSYYASRGFRGLMKV